MPQLMDLSEHHIVQAYGVRLLGPKNKHLKLLNKHYEPSVHGDQNWLSSFLLIDYLLHNRTLKKSSRVMELGCGWGAVSIFCNRHAGSHVTGIDMDANVFPYLEAQAAINDAKVTTKKAKFEKLNGSLLNNYDLILGTDICFWDQLTPVLFKLIKRAFKSGVKEIVLADPGRGPFLELAEQCLEKFPGECVEWYCSEPKLFEGYILHLKNSQ